MNINKKLALGLFIVTILNAGAHATVPFEGALRTDVYPSSLDDFCCPDVKTVEVKVPEVSNLPLITSLLEFTINKYPVTSGAASHAFCTHDHEICWLLIKKLFGQLAHCNPQELNIIAKKLHAHLVHKALDIPSDLQKITDLLLQHLCPKEIAALGKTIAIHLKEMLQKETLVVQQHQTAPAVGIPDLLSARLPDSTIPFEPQPEKSEEPLPKTNKETKESEEESKKSSGPAKKTSKRKRLPKQKIYRCTEHNKSFTTEAGYRMHINTIHLGLRHYCDYDDNCTESFTRMSDLNGHISSDHKKLLYTCPFCHQQYKHKRYVDNAHKRMCSGLRKSRKKAKKRRQKEDF